jgi:hypothetical protein
MLDQILRAPLRILDPREADELARTREPWAEAWRAITRDLEVGEYCKRPDAGPAEATSGSRKPRVPVVSGA